MCKWCFLEPCIVRQFLFLGLLIAASIENEEIALQDYRSTHQQVSVYALTTENGVYIASVTMQLTSEPTYSTLLPEQFFLYFLSNVYETFHNVFLKLSSIFLMLDTIF